MTEEKAPASRCDFCAYYDYDEESEQYYCQINLDEDEMQHFLAFSDWNCPYFNPYDEYKVVRHQN